MTSYLHLYITNKYCALKRLMHGKRILSYTTRIFPSRRLKRKVSGPFTERFYYPNGGLNNGKSRCTACLAYTCGPAIFSVETFIILQTFQHPLNLSLLHRSPLNIGFLALMLIQTLVLFELYPKFFALSRSRDRKLQRSYHSTVFHQITKILLGFQSRFCFVFK